MTDTAILEKKLNAFRNEHPDRDEMDMSDVPVTPAVADLLNRNAVKNRCPDYDATWDRDTVVPESNTGKLLSYLDDLLFNDPAVESQPVYRKIDLEQAQPGDIVLCINTHHNRNNMIAASTASSAWLPKAKGVRTVSPCAGTADSHTDPCKLVWFDSPIVTDPEKLRKIEFAYEIWSRRVISDNTANKEV